MTGFVQFDPDKWEPGAAANPAKVAKADDDKPDALASLATLAGVHAAGVRSLRAESPPRGVDAQSWAAAVLDAVRLMESGWAAQAFALGWSAFDLFGAVPDPDGNPAADGLAVKLNGRRVLALCANFATVANASGGRAYLYRGCNDGARLLWALDRGR